MISEGDYFIVTKSADGKRVAVPVGTKEGLTDDKFILVKTADGKKVPCAVSGKPSDGDRFLPVLTADGKRVAAPLGGGGSGGGKVTELPNVVYVPRPNTVTVYDNPTEVLFDFDGTGPLGNTQYAFHNLHYRGVDGSGDTTPITDATVNTILPILPGGKYDLEWYEGLSSSGALYMRTRYITQKFNPSTVGWGTLPTFTTIRSWALPRSDKRDYTERTGNFSLLEGDDLTLSHAVSIGSNVVYGLSFSFYIQSGAVLPGSSWTFDKPVANAEIITGIS